MPTISANGTAGGIVWGLEAAGILHAYDAANLANELYHSNQNRARDALGRYVKFTVPAVANGKVYAGTQNSLVVYGLLPFGGPAFSVGNAASGDPNAIAPGSIVSIYGANLAQATDTAKAFPLPATLAGASVRVNSVAAPLFYASPGQINAQVPFGVAAGTAAVEVRSGDALVGTANVTVRPAAPGLFTNDDQAAVLNQDGSVNSAGRPAGAGSVVAAYLTGLGPVDNPVPTGSPAAANPLSRVTSPVIASIAGQSATVLFAGLAPGFAGLYQVNILVPQMAPGDYPLQVSVAGVASNAATLSVQ